MLGESELARFADGSRVFDLRLPEGPVDPGQPLAVGLRLEGPPARWALAFGPPRSLARQVALGGPGGPTEVLPDDGRSVRVEFEGSGVQDLELVPPAGWHARQGMLTLERIDGRMGAPARIAATAGARTASGIAILGLLDVEPPPAFVQAPAMRGVVLDGVLDEPAWQSSPRTALVSSLHGDPIALGAKREDDPGWGDSLVQFGWDAEALYVGATLPDRDLRGTQTKRDDPLWTQEAFEVFVFAEDGTPASTMRGDARYVELQVSPRGVQFDAAFESYRKGDESWNGTWGAAVNADGTLEDPSDVDAGYSVELALPWSELCARTHLSCDIAVGKRLRMNVFRLERPRKGATIGLALSPTRVPDFHAPQNAAVLELVAGPS